jgi:bifunctional DNA-binding transcriptional regulator/antitoxin component of YhaV-PrlF toxin-antitoxin module
VGSKGELFPSKAIREKIGLKACSKVIFTIESGRLIVEPVPTIKEAIEMGTSIEITLDEFHKQRRALSRQAEA